MKKKGSSPIFKEKPNKSGKWVTNMGRLAPILLSSLGITFILSSFFFYPTNPFGGIDQRLLPIKPEKGISLRTFLEGEDLKKSLKDDKDCDLFKGHWIPDHKGSPYTNASCSTIPASKNCLMQGRPDTDFLYWRWKPDGCDLPRFDPKLFLKMVRGKNMTFVGDSVARNHMESLICLLSTEETPQDIYKDSEDRNRIWHFPNHRFQLSTSWTKFLVAENERTDANNTGTGVYDLYIDKMDDGWAQDIATADIAIVSAAHWFFRPIVLHKGNTTLGCVYCSLPNMTQISPEEAFRLVYASVFKHIEECNTCKGSLKAVLRTFAPAHFENGTWNTGGRCKRTSPLGESEIDLHSNEMKVRSSQVGELDKMVNNRDRHRRKKKFGVLDITRAMLMRPDGHPDAYWGNKWMKGYSDCVHWCMPGPIDAWNDFLMAVLRRLS